MNETFETLNIRRDGAAEYRQEAAKLTGEASIALLFRHPILADRAPEPTARFWRVG